MVNSLRSKLATTRTKWGGGGASDILVSTSTDLIAHSRKRPEDHFSLTRRDKMCRWKNVWRKVTHMHVILSNTPPACDHFMNLEAVYGTCCVFMMSVFVLLFVAP